MSYNARLEALDHAIKSTLSGSNSTDTIVNRATIFYSFLTENEEKLADVIDINRSKAAHPSNGKPEGWDDDDEDIIFVPSDGRDIVIFGHTRAEVFLDHGDRVEQIW